MHTTVEVEQLLTEIRDLVTDSIAARVEEDRSMGGPPVYLISNPVGAACTVRLTWAEDALQMFILTGGWADNPAATSAATVTFRNVTASMVAAAIVDVLL